MRFIQYYAVVKLIMEGETCEINISVYQVDMYGREHCSNSYSPCRKSDCHTAVHMNEKLEDILIITIS